MRYWTQPGWKHCSAIPMFLSAGFLLIHLTTNQSLFKTKQMHSFPKPDQNVFCALGHGLHCHVMFPLRRSLLLFRWYINDKTLLSLSSVPLFKVVLFHSTGRPLTFFIWGSLFSVLLISHVVTLTLRLGDHPYSNFSTCFGNTQQHYLVRSYVLCIGVGLWSFRNGNLKFLNAFITQKAHE